MNEINYVRLSKTISHALRHAPWLYELELDQAGWTSIEALLDGLRRHRPAWRNLQEADLEAMLARPGKQRFEIREGQIRALYAHSIQTRIEKVAVEPPPRLFHGTAARTSAIIRREGLKPMNRQYVHLSADEATAHEVGRRKAREPVILIVDAATAYDAGLSFYHGNKMIWLADRIPPAYISQLENSND